MLIERPPLLFRLLFPGAVWRIKSADKKVYLTFDDGPTPHTTPWLLDKLDSFGAKAAFFLVGENALKHPQLLDQIRRRGHVVGNHTMRHTQGLHVDNEQFLNDIEEANRLLRTNLFRPPHGFMGPGQMSDIKRKGYTVVMQDVVTRDYDPSMPPEKILSIVKRYVRPGSIIVFHDSAKSRDNVMRALPAALEWLRAQGYAFGDLRDLVHPLDQ